VLERKNNHAYQLKTKSSKINNCCFLPNKFKNRKITKMAVTDKSNFTINSDKYALFFTHMGKIENRAHRLILIPFKAIRHPTNQKYDILNKLFWLQ
jgi:hypothetical protein